MSKMNDSIEGAAAKNVIGMDTQVSEYSRSRNESEGIHIFPEPWQIGTLSRSTLDQLFLQVHKKGEIFPVSK